MTDQPKNSSNHREVIQTALLIGFAQFVNHLIFYLDVRFASRGSVLIPVVLDTIHMVLGVAVFKRMLKDSVNWYDWASLLVGGILGTWLGLSLPS